MNPDVIGIVLEWERDCTRFGFFVITGRVLANGSINKKSIKKRLKKSKPVDFELFRLGWFVTTFKALKMTRFKF